MKSEMEKLREKQQRRRRKRTLRILAISPLIAFAFVAAISLLTRIQTVILRNPTVYGSYEICQQFPFSVGDSLFSVDRDKLEEQLVSSCPYIKTADVRYRFPNQIEIDLTAAAVTYAASLEEGFLLLDEDFKALEVVETAPESVLLLQGMEIQSYTVGQSLNEEENLQIGIVRDLVKNLNDHSLYGQVSCVDFTKKHSISMQIFDVISVNLGNSENFEEKFILLDNILQDNNVVSENPQIVPAEISVRDSTTGRYSRLPDPETESSETLSTDSEQEEVSTDSSDDKKDDNS